MTVQLIDNLWLATGRGPLRPIVVEAGTRREAVVAFADVLREQLKAQVARGESSDG